MSRIIMQSALLAALTFAVPLSPPVRSDETVKPVQAKTSFDRRGFYLHGCWVMEHPFSVRSWERDDFAGMFRLLKSIGYTTVMIWITPETAPMPLSSEDAATLRGYRPVIDDAKQAGLECWFCFCPNVISTDEVRGLPWKDRSLYSTTQLVKVAARDAKSKAYLDHRRAILQCVDNADAFVVIDGDPGSYPGAPLEEFISILNNDRIAVHGKPVIPWLWSGWGRDTNVGSFWGNSVGPLVGNSLRALHAEFGDNLHLMPGRSHREDWANGRVPIAETKKAGLLSQSTLMCYEAVEFEPTPPGFALQFDLIRKVLRQEAELSPEARGVFGNCECAVLVLPNIYFFARGAADLSYLNRTDVEVLTDLAREFGDTQGVLVHAWRSLDLPLSEVPADLAERVLALRLDTGAARNIPGGPRRYLEIIAAQVKSRRELLEAAAAAPTDAETAAEILAKGANALIDWWQVHHYVFMGKKGDQFRWEFIKPGQVAILRGLGKRCAAIDPGVVKSAAKTVSAKQGFSAAQAEALMSQVCM